MKIPHLATICTLVLAIATSACGSQRVQTNGPSVAEQSAAEALLTKWILPTPDYKGTIDYAGTTSAPAPSKSNPTFSSTDLRHYLAASPNPVAENGAPDIALRLVGKDEALTWVVTYHHTPIVVFGPIEWTQEQRSYDQSGDCDSVFFVDATRGTPGDTIQICTVPQETRDLIASGKFTGTPDWTLYPA